MTVEVRRAEERGRTETAGIISRHSFSYGSYYDPDNLAFGPVMAVNDDVVTAGHGFAWHRHRDVEIVTWVVSGALMHTDDAGHHHTLTPGSAQFLGAGRGVRHAEVADPADPAGTRYVQMWVRPSAVGLAPVYAAADFAALLGAGQWVPVASGFPDSPAPLRLRQLDAELRVLRLPAGATAALPVAALVHVQVVSGAIELDSPGGGLRAGDCLRIRGDQRLVARSVQAAELLAWVLPGARS